MRRPSVALRPWPWAVVAVALGACATPPASAPAGPSPDAVCAAATCAECVRREGCTYDAGGLRCIALGTRCNDTPCVHADEAEQCRALDALGRAP